MTVSFKTVCLIALISLIVLKPVDAKDQNLQFQHLLVEDGLSNSWVKCILKDSHGFMWFGTMEGLNKYDGYRFSVYKHKPGDPSSLGQSNIGSILEDSRRRLWIGTYGGGLGLYDRDKDRFINFPLDSAAETLDKRSNIRALCEDGDGRLWIGSQNGLAVLDPDTRQIVLYRHDAGDEGSLSHNSVRIIKKDKNGRLWIGTENGLNALDMKTGSFIRFLVDSRDDRGRTDREIRSLYVDDRNMLWIGTFGGRLISLNAGALDSGGPTTDINLVHIARHSIYCITGDGRGNLFIGTTGGGLNVFSFSTGSSRKYLPDLDEETSINSNSIHSLFYDDQGILWIGTFNGGVNLMSRQMQGFRHVPARKNGLNNPNVLGIIEDRNGDIWIGTDGGGLNRWDRKKERFRYYLPDPKDPKSLSETAVTALFEDSRGLIWAGTYLGGLNRFDRRTGGFAHFSHDPKDSTTIQDDRVYCLFEDREGTLYAGTYTGMDCFEGKTGAFRRLGYPAIQGRAICMIEDRKGDLWIGTLHGLSLIDRRNKTVKNFIHDPNDPQSIGPHWVTALCEDSKGHIWMGLAGGGLCRFNAPDQTWIRYTTRDGLPDDNVVGLVEDRAGNLWLSTYHGVAKMVEAVNLPEKPEFIHFDLHDGLQGYEFRENASFKSKNGEIFFGGNHGFNTFYPEDIVQNTHVPPVVLTDLQIFNKDVGIGIPGSPLEKSITESREIKLSYRQSMLTFGFAALNFILPAKNRYAYRMEGFDSDWIEAGTQQRATYTNLNPGKYVFRVKASNNDGVWNQEGVSLDIRITPPFWETWIFRLGTGIVLLSMIYGGVEFRLKSVRKRKEELELLVDQRTHEIKNNNILLEKTNLELQHANQTLKNSEEEYRTLFEKAINPIFVLDDNGNCINCNTAALRYFSAKEDELLGRNIEYVIRPFRNKSNSNTKTPVWKSKESILLEKGKPKWKKHLELTFLSATYLNRQWIFGVGIDVTERKLAENRIQSSLQEKELLLKEIHHRVKNNLQVIKSLLRLQSDQIEDKRIVDMFKESQNRIQSMALIHEQLYRSDNLAKINFSDYIKKLTTDLFQTLRVNDTKVTLDLQIEDISMGIDQAVPSGLILNELISNALKHAFPSRRRRENKIGISFYKEDQTIHLNVWDNGVGIPKTIDVENISSLGLRLIFLLAQDQLGGEVKIIKDGGTRFQISYQMT